MDMLSKAPMKRSHASLVQSRRVMTLACLLMSSGAVHAAGRGSGHLRRDQGAEAAPASAVSHSHLVREKSRQTPRKRAGKSLARGRLLRLRKHSSRDALLSRAYRRPGRRGRFVDDLFYGRKIRIYIPDSVDLNSEPHVAVFLDGQDIFGLPEPGLRSGFWHAAETMDRLIDAGEMPPTIAVAVWHGHQNRIDEYAPSPARLQLDTSQPSRVYGGAPSKAHDRYLVEKLRPWIAQTFGVRNAPSRWAIIGSSMGGLKALQLGLEHPEAFGSVLAFSPSLWWDRGIFGNRVSGQRRLADMASAAPQSFAPRIFLSHGGYDAPGRRGSGDGGNETHRLHKHLKSRRATENLTLGYRYTDSHAHNQQAWADVLPEALRFAFRQPAL